MIALLWNLLVGQFCRHKWKILREGSRTCFGAISGGWYDLQCEKCGMVRSKKT